MLRIASGAYFVRRISSFGRFVRVPGQLATVCRFTSQLLHLQPDFTRYSSLGIHQRFHPGKKSNAFLRLSTKQDVNCVSNEEDQLNLVWCQCKSSKRIVNDFCVID